MELEKWVELVGKFGLPTVALLALGWMFYRVIVQTVWPFFVKQIEVAQAQRQAEMDKFMAAMMRRDEMAATAQRETLHALHAMADELRTLRTEVLQQKVK